MKKATSERRKGMPFDLHCHTRLSDGSMEIEDLVEFAVSLGLSGIAVTVHDTFEGAERAIKAADGRLEIIPGIELSCYDFQRERKVHLLCYYPEMTDELSQICRQMNERRQRASQEMLRQVLALYPISQHHLAQISRTGTTLYRAHIMHALMDMGYADAIYGSLYRTLFDSKTGSCFCRTEYTEVYAALAAAHRAQGVVCMAHPGVYRSYELLEELCQQNLLDGVEYDYPRRKEDERQLLDRIVPKYGLIPTGGTDFHGSYTPVPVDWGHVRHLLGF
jgi:predicted metal-dependent phosphoesterase TrpH